MIEEKLKQLEPRCKGENKQQGGHEGRGWGPPDGGVVGTPFTASVVVTPSGCCWTGPGSTPGASTHLQEEPLHHGPLTLVVSSLTAVNTSRPAAVSG